MRGDDQQLQTGMFSYVALEDRISADHPLRGVRRVVDEVLAGMSEGLRWSVLQTGTALDSAGAAAAGTAGPDPLLAAIQIERVTVSIFFGGHNTQVVPTDRKASSLDDKLVKAFAVKRLGPPRASV